jgi:hypothetical protein
MSRWFGRAGAIVLGAALLGGCASFTGEPASLVATGDFAETAVLTEFSTLNSEVERRRYRDRIVYHWIGLSDAGYIAFRQNLSREMKGLETGSSIAVLIMNGAAAVSGAEAARALAVGSATMIGANSVFNREVFMEQSLAAALSTAEAARLRAMTQIRRRLLLEDTSTYPLGDALIELRALNAQASINNASVQMARTAANELTDAQAEALTVVRMPLVSPSIQAVREAFSAYVIAETRLPTLNALAQLLAVAKPGDQTLSEADGLRIYQQDIADAYALRAARGADVINALSPQLKAITEREFKL